MNVQKILLARVDRLQLFDRISHVVGLVSMSHHLLHAQEVIVLDLGTGTLGTERGRVHVMTLYQASPARMMMINSLRVIESALVLEMIILAIGRGVVRAILIQQTGITVCVLDLEIVFRLIVSLFLEHRLQCTEHRKSLSRQEARLHQAHR